MIKKVQTIGSHAVTQQIIAVINEGKLRPGDSLGTEKELVARFAATGRSVREAIVGLQSLGVVESIKKSGIRVARPKLSSLLAMSIDILGRSEGGFQQLKELRYTLELGALRVAAKRINAEALANFHHIVDEYQQVIDEQGAFTRLIEIDRRFHETLLQSTGNPLIHEQHSVVSEYFRRHLIENGEKDTTWDERKVFLWEHREIVNGIQEGNIEYAEIILARHIGRVVFG